MSEEKSQEIKMHWYVVQAFSGHEKKVSEWIKQAIELKGMDSYFGDVLVPTEEVVEVKADKRVKSTRRFFPGYILIHMHASDEAIKLVCSVDKVTGFLGTDVNKQRPTPISQKEIDTILGRVQKEGEAPRPKVAFEVNEEVRVVDGTFKDFNAVIKEVHYDKDKVKTSITLFGKETDVELKISQIEKQS